MKNEKLYRESWSLFPTGVSVIAALDNKKNVHGMTANSISSISLNPNILMVSIGMERSIKDHLSKSTSISISVLASDQIQIANHFAISNSTNFSKNNNYFQFSNEYFFIGKCLSFYFGKIIETHKIGDHEVYFIEVKYFDLFKNKEPLVWYRGKFSKPIC
jgi:flavin reductase (DIM6/NTAB) family NADH-FMN oxidoreductase RutF|tara:strand:+ start:2648 stop:3127 length:480 start_codon:yes stop_codon:yes gene_type:complete